MESKLRGYRGERITVTYDVRRCIHAKECVHGLPEVFDLARRPWVDPDAAEPERIAGVVRACPTGALKFEPAPGGQSEAPPALNTITIVADGPLYLHGRLELEGAAGEEPVPETRAALCRCGGSSNKPFCDNSHGEIGFADPGEVADPKLAPADEPDGDGPLRITCAANGPLLLRGLVALHAAGETVARGSKGALCRCGASANKPFCDGSHVAIGFEAEGR